MKATRKLNLRECLVTQTCWAKLLGWKSLDYNGPTGARRCA